MNANEAPKFRSSRFLFLVNIKINMNDASYNTVNGSYCSWENTVISFVSPHCDDNWSVDKKKEACEQWRLESLSHKRLNRTWIQEFTQFDDFYISISWIHDSHPNQYRNRIFFLLLTLFHNSVGIWQVLNLVQEKS